MSVFKKIFHVSSFAHMEYIEYKKCFNIYVY